MDTVFALATARGKSGVAVIRLSGPKAFAVAERLVGELPEVRRAGLRTVVASSGDVIDEALVLRFSSGASFTGEDVVELQVHGSQAVVQAISRELNSCKGVRHALPGEFTRRALENNRMDLAEIEGLGDLIEAETEAQRRQAVQLMSGRLGDAVEVWRSKLLSAVALLEATIDFVDEDVPVDVIPDVDALLQNVLGSMQTEVAGVPVAERLRGGFQVAILGAPNVGKSTLLNALAGREIAITSDIAGTTRDVIEARLDVGGIPVSFLDTAGLRETSDQIEQIGVARAQSAARQADLRVFLIHDDGGLPDAPRDDDDLVLVGKDDFGARDGVSGVTGYGVERLLDHVGAVFAKRVSVIGSATQERHRSVIEDAVIGLSSVMDRLAGDVEAEMIVEDLRRVLFSLELLLGRVDTEDVLDVIFSKFCIGK